MNQLGINFINYYIPEKKISVRELLEQVPTEKIPASFSGKEAYEAFITDELNVTSIRVEDELEDYEMLRDTVEKIFLDDILEPEEIDLIVLAQEPDRRQKDHLGQYIQHEFDLVNAYILNVSGNHCANIDYSLTLATALARGDERLNNILILGNVKIAEPAKRLVGTYGLLSDGSGAMLLRKNAPGPRLVDSLALSAGRFHQVDLDRDESLLLCKYYIKCLQGLLEKNDLNRDMIRQIIVQNANPLLVAQCLEAVGLDTSIVFSDNQTRYAHLDCLDILVNLKDCLDAAPDADRNGLILTFGTGWAGSFIASLLSYH